MAEKIRARAKMPQSERRQIRVRAQRERGGGEDAAFRKSPLKYVSGTSHRTRANIMHDARARSPGWEESAQHACARIPHFWIKDLKILISKSLPTTDLQFASQNIEPVRVMRK